MPSTSQRALASTLASTAGPLRRIEEMLVLLDLCAVARLHGDDRRAAGGESELAPAGERRDPIGRAARRGARLPLGAKPGRAPDAGRQGLAGHVDPDPIARPAARAHRRRTLARDGERVGEPWVAERDHRVRELIVTWRTCATSPCGLAETMVVAAAEKTVAVRTDQRPNRTADQSAHEASLDFRASPWGGPRLGANLPGLSAPVAVIELDLPALRLDVAQARIHHRGIDEVR